MRTTLNLNPRGGKKVNYWLVILKTSENFLRLSFLEYTIVFCQIHTSLIEHYT